MCMASAFTSHNLIGGSINGPSMPRTQEAVANVVKSRVGSHRELKESCEN